tara:strand:+ start:26657 stop:26908 length:252 start_codon:yes stop_codon:yes gene_type:complete
VLGSKGSGWWAGVGTASLAYWGGAVRRREGNPAVFALNCLLKPGQLGCLEKLMGNKRLIGVWEFYAAPFLLIVSCCDAFTAAE